MKYILLLLFACGCNTTQINKPHYEIHSPSGAIMKLNPETGETWMYYTIQGVGGAWVKVNEVDVSKLTFQMPKSKDNY